MEEVVYEGGEEFKELAERIVVDPVKQLSYVHGLEVSKLAFLLTIGEIMDEEDNDSDVLRLATNLLLLRCSIDGRRVKDVVKILIGQRFRKVSVTQHIGERLLRVGGEGEE